MPVYPGICTFCGTGCGHLLQVTGPTVEAVFPVRTHPVSRGRLCVRGWNVHELLRTPDRIVQPRLRTPEGWKSLTYEDAFAWLNRRLLDLGPDRGDQSAVIASPRASNEESYLTMRFAREVLRTNHIAVDNEGGHLAALQAIWEGSGFGAGRCSFEWIRNADFLLTVDFDATRQNPIIGSELHFAAREGAHLVVIDSRRTQTARLSRRFLQVRPGSTDFALAALAKHLVEREEAAARVLERPGGREWLATLGGLAWEQLLGVTGLSRNAIADTADRLASVRQALALFPTGIFGLPARTVRWISNLFLTVGATESSNSGLFPVPGINNLQGSLDMGLAPGLLTGYQPLEDADVRKHFGSRWGVEPPDTPGFPLGELFEQGKRPRLAIVVDHDEGVVRFGQALREVETVVYVGAFENPFTEFAHLVLPIAAYSETVGTFTNGERRVQISGRKLSPPTGVLEGWRFWVEAAAACGWRWPFTSPREVMEEIADLTPAYRGLSHDLLAQTWGGVQWPLADTLKLREERSGVSPKPFPRFVALQELGEPSSPSDEYPFLLLFGKSQHYWHLNNLLNKTFIPRREYNALLLLYPDGFVEMAAEDARRLRVRDKEKVRIRSRRGGMELQVKVSDDVLPGALYVPYFVRDMVNRFLLEHKGALQRGETACVPVTIERIG